MIDLSHCILLGTITKTHGIRGQVILRMKGYDFDDILEMESVFIEIDGLPVPFFVSEYKEKNADSLILSFEQVNSADNTAEILNCKVFVNASTVSVDSNPAAQTDALIGFAVKDIHHGMLGILEEILDFNENPLFRIVQGEKEILLPVQAEFIAEIHKPSKTITVNIPDGLLDLS